MPKGGCAARDCVEPFGYSKEGIEIGKAWFAGNRLGVCETVSGDISGERSVRNPTNPKAKGLARSEDSVHEGWRAGGEEDRSQVILSAPCFYQRSGAIGDPVSRIAARLRWGISYPRHTPKRKPGRRWNGRLLKGDHGVARITQAHETALGGAWVILPECGRSLRMDNVGVELAHTMKENRHIMRPLRGRVLEDAVVSAHPLFKANTLRSARGILALRAGVEDSCGIPVAFRT